MSKIEPGDWVEITPFTNKITIKAAKKIKPKGAPVGSLITPRGRGPSRRPQQP